MSKFRFFFSNFGFLLPLGNLFPEKPTCQQLNGDINYKRKTIAFFHARCYGFSQGRKSFYNGAVYVINKKPFLADCDNLWNVALVFAFPSQSALVFAAVANWSHIHSGFELTAPEQLRGTFLSPQNICKFKTIILVISQRVLQNVKAKCHFTVFCNSMFFIIVIFSV